MSWMPAASIRTRAAHTSRMPVPSEQREWTNLSRSYRVGSGLVGEASSPGSVRLFSRRKIPLSPFSSNFAHRLGVHSADARAHSRKRKWAYFAQFWCNPSPLDATLLSPLLCVAFKELAQYLSPLDATLAKNIGGGGVGRLKLYPTRGGGTLQFLLLYLVISLLQFIFSGGTRSGVN
jgi:hypothetical protein